MINARKKTAAALAGAVVLGSAGYALGSGSGGGAASAAAGSASAPAGYGYGSGAGLAGLASRLGVSESKLRDALEAVRDDVAPKGERRDEGLKALADALGKTTAQVQAAFDQLHEAREDEFAAALARELGVPASKVEAALEKLRPEKRERRGRREGFAELAEALGVTTEQLEAAEEKARAAHEAEHERRRKAFAAALAKELGIDAAKVEEELGDGPLFSGPGGPGGHHRGPR